MGMMRLLFIIAISILVFSCSGRVKESNPLTPKEGIKDILDSFVQKNAHENYLIYELYINKLHPEHTEMILYAGDFSLTLKKEVERYGLHPIAYTISNGVKIHIYSGIELYFTNPFEREENQPLSNIRTGRETILAIKDNCGVINTYEISGGYPFITLPIDIKLAEP